MALLKSVRDDRLTATFGSVLSMDAETVGFLISSARQGDVKAFERLYRLYCGKVYGLCLRMIREPAAAEDCVQQTFIQAWRNIDRFEQRSSFSTWLHHIAVNSVLSHKRSNKSWLEFGADFATADNSGAPYACEEKPLDAGDVGDIERALMSLPDGARIVVVLQAIYGYSHEEVAKMLGIAVGTCKAQLHRARRILRDKLDLEDAHA